MNVLMRPALLVVALLAFVPAAAQNLISTGASSGLRLYMTNGNDFWLDPTDGSLVFKVNGNPVSTMTPQGFWLVNGVNAISNTGITASSITTTITGNTQYAVRSSSGVNVVAGGVVAPFFTGTHTGDGSRLTSISAANVSGTLAVGNGGTGSATASGARTNLDAQQRVTGTCAAGTAISVVASDGTVTCEPVLGLTAGLIVMSTGTCPSGYEELLSFAGRFPKGRVAGTTGATYGTSLADQTDITHTHTFTPAGTNSAPTFSGTNANTGGNSAAVTTYTTANATLTGPTVASNGHTHNYTPAGTVSAPTFTGSGGTTASGTHTPPYIQVRFCMKN